MDGKTRVCGVMGNPVEHSMSPQMQNFYAERTGVNLAYVPFHVEKDVYKRQCSCSTVCWCVLCVTMGTRVCP